MLNVIVAGCYTDTDKLGIGYEGKILWKIPEDMKRFKEITWGGIVIMGRKTWDSIPEKFRPLPERQNVIVSRTISQNIPDVYVADSLENAISFCQKFPEKKIFIIGGEQIYTETVKKFSDKICKLYVTVVEDNFVSDAYFPILDYGNINRKYEVSSSEKMTSGKYSFHYETYNFL